MSYLVLARKYRPKTFTDMIGQEHVVRTLRNAIALGRVHHAFVFSGVRGVGKTTAARVLARALNCAEGPTADPCDRCPNCIGMLAGNSADVIEIDGASNTGVDHVRSLRESAQYMPSSGRYKLFIIDEVHMLSNAAFNALLKILEEPPAHVKFIFATTEPRKIPVTVLSRCQRYDFRRVSVGALQKHVAEICKAEGISIGDDALYTVATQAQGSVRDALSLLDQVLSFVGSDPSPEAVAACLGAIDRDMLFAVMDAVASRDAQALLAMVRDGEQRGYDPAAFAGALCEHVRDMRVAAIVEGQEQALLERSTDDIARLKAQYAKRHTDDWDRMFALLTQTTADIGRSPHPQISLEMGLLRLLQIESSASVASLMARIDAMMGAPIVGAVAATVKPQPTAHARPPLVGAVREPPVNPQPVVQVRVDPGGAVREPCHPRESGDPQVKTDVASTWRQAVESVRRTRVACASIWEHAWVLSFTPERVVLGFAQGFYLDAANGPENRNTLQQALGGSIAIEVREVKPTDVPPGTVCLAKYDAALRDEKVEAVKHAAIHHSAVQSSMHILDASITHVELLQE